MAQVRTQASMRRDINPRDQFGRKWLMTIELVTGDPTGGITPAGWTDPLATPGHYIKVPKNADGQAELGRVVVNFDQWIADHEEAERVWYAQLHVNARDVYKRLDPTDVAQLEQDKFLLDLTGPKPKPSVEVLKRARAGDRALLGLEAPTLETRRALGAPTLADLKMAPASTGTADDTRVPDTYPEFVSWVFRTGGVRPGDLKSAAELWKAHKAAMAPA